MISKELQRKQYILKVLADSHASAIVLELLNARDAGKSSVPHKELLWLVDVNIGGSATLYWQQSMRELVDNLGIVELLVEEGKPYGPDSISYRLNPQMDSFIAALIDLMFKGEKGSREKLPPEPKSTPNRGKDATQPTDIP